MSIVRAAAMILLCSGIAFAQKRPIPKTPDVCGLVTKGEVEGALKQAVSKGPTPGGMGPMTTCEFEIGDGPIKGQWNLQQLTCSEGSFKTLAGASADPITGIGDVAAWNGDMLTVRKGSQCLFVPGWTGPGSLDIAKVLAGKAVARLPK